MFRKLAKKVLSKSPGLYSSAHTFKFEKTHKQDFSNLTSEEKQLAAQVKENGYAVLPDFFSKEFCEKCIEDIDWMFENKKEFIQEREDKRIYGAEELSENIRKFAEHELFDKIANAYIGVPTCNGFSLAARIEAKGIELGSGGKWHRDSFFRQFKSIIYLNDVDENNGPFQILIDSHKPGQKDIDKKLGNLGEFNDSYDQSTIDKILKNNPERLLSISGKAGTVILVDTSIIHRGKPVKNGIRYTLFNYFFEKTQINSHLIEHFSPLVSAEKVLQKAN